MSPSPRKYLLLVFALLAALGLAGVGIFLSGQGGGPKTDEDLQALLDGELRSDAPFRWERILRAAVKVGEATGMDLPRLVRLSHQIPSELRPHYFEGVAHGIRWPYDHMKACAEAIDRAVPRQYREYIYYGPIQYMTRQLHGDPKQVMPRLKDLPPQMKPHIKNGLRIGLLLHYNEDLREAVQVILQYPPEYHEDMFEEHGWWMGQNLVDDVKQVEAIIDLVPEKLKAESYHGYIRGLDPSDDPQMERRIIAKVNPRFKKICLAALKEKYHGPPDKDKSAGRQKTGRATTP